ncbi:MAG: hypothetical protein U0470_12865 [Anaerolineae bacterium]
MTGVGRKRPAAAAQTAEPAALRADHAVAGGVLVADADRVALHVGERQRIDRDVRRVVVEHDGARLHRAAHVEAAQHVAGAVNAERPVEPLAAGVDLDDVVRRARPVGHALAEVDRDVRAGDVQAERLAEVIRHTPATASKLGSLRFRQYGPGSFASQYRARIRRPARRSATVSIASRSVHASTARSAADARRPVGRRVDVHRRQVRGAGGTGRRHRQSGARRGEQPGGDERGDAAGRTIERRHAGLLGCG